MKKLILIGLKDVRLAFRDRTALIMMLLTPFLLTLGIGFVTGQLSGGSTGGVSQIPVVLVNHDSGPVGLALADVLTSPDLAGLLRTTEATDPALARALVDANKADAAVLVPAGFSDSVLSLNPQAAGAAPLLVELYGNPTTPTAAGVVKIILDQFLGQVEARRVGTRVITQQLVSRGLLAVQDASKVGQRLTSEQGSTPAEDAVSLAKKAPSGASGGGNPMALVAAGMALMFVMWSATYGGRVLLAERSQGTLPRLLVSPTTRVQVLGGKIFGTFLTSVAQVLILILGTTLLFRLSWGDPLGVLALVLAAVFAAVGWGLVITSVAKSPGQVTSLGTAAMLVFGLLGGTFFSLHNAGSFIQLLSKITPNAWGLDGFTTLAMGGRLPDILTPILSLLAIGAVLFLIAVALFSRIGITEP